MATMVTTEHTETDERTDPQAAFERARERVRDLEAALADLPEAYTRAVKAGDASAMKAARHARIDLEEEISVARIVATRAEVVVLDEEVAALGPREQEAARAVTETFGKTKIAQAELEELIAQNARAQGDAAAIRAHRESLTHRRWGLQERLKMLTAIELPD